MSIFHFKQFSIQQEVAAVKVGTDAMLLGCLTSLEKEDQVLEIGTGTGVISLMLAQRFSDSFIDALEIHVETAEEATLNVKRSPFKERIKVFQQDFLLFHPSKSYDVIVSNPPYFEKGLLPEDEKLKLAKHIDYGVLSSWFVHISSLLSDVGRCWMILPSASIEAWLKIANYVGLILIEQVDLYAKPSVCKRVIICLSKIPETKVHSFFLIRKEDGTYTDEYITLTKEFHNRIPHR